MTPAFLAEAYELLSEAEPFLSLNLPPSDEILFRVIKTTRWHADCEKLKRKSGGEKYCIRVSRGANSHILSVLAAMAHEKIHVHQHEIGQAPTHNEFFNRIAAQACALHGFDPKTF